MITPRQKLVDVAKWNIKCPYPMTPTRIVVHNTANDASAENEIAYMIRNNDETSYHFAIDDKEVVQGIPLDRCSWQAGDGANGIGNREGISLEICYSLSGGDRFIKAEKLAAQFIAQLLNERKWGIDKVTKHQDYSGKYCPHRTLDMGWQRFLDMISAELKKLQTPDVIITYQSFFGKWGAEIKSNTGSYSGDCDHPISGIRAKSTVGKVYIQSRLINGKELGLASAYVKDGGAGTGYSGQMYNGIDAFRVKVEGIDPTKVRYRGHWDGKNGKFGRWYTAAEFGWAGLAGHLLDAVQIMVVK